MNLQYLFMQFIHTLPGIRPSFVSLPSAAPDPHVHTLNINRKSLFKQGSHQKRKNSPVNHMYLLK